MNNGVIFVLVLAVAVCIPWVLEFDNSPKGVAAITSMEMVGNRFFIYSGNECYETTQAVYEKVKVGGAYLLRGVKHSFTFSTTVDSVVEFKAEPEQR